MSNKVALFAGQGAQFVGMGKDLLGDADVAALFQRANEVLGYDIATICFEGPMEELTRSDHCQPAIFVVSTACFTVFRKRFPECAFSAYAGLSLGEWSALCAAGVLDFESTVRVLEARGRYMQEACEQNPSGMVSVMRLPFETVRQIAADTGAHISNINSQQQVVLSGTKEVCDKVVAATAAAKGKAIPLAVAGAFHSPFMEPARVRLAEFLKDIPFQAPKTPVLSNARGTFHSSDPEEIRQAMLDQVTGSVRWLECIQNSGAHAFLEFGPGKTLTNLAKRIDAANAAADIQGLASLDAAADVVNA